MKLWEFINKNVRVSIANGKIFAGHVVDFTSTEDNIDTESAPPCQSISVDDGAGTIWELYENEITNIELIISDAPIMAKAI